jgi:hypothetical protein
MFNQALSRVSSKVTAAVLLAAAALPAFAVDPADGPSAISGITSSSSGYTGPMLGLALFGVGVMVAVKWIKRGKSAA